MTGSVPAERAGAIVVGAGSGQRLGGVEKAFFPVLERPLIAYAVDVFERSTDVDVICLVLSAQSLARGRALSEACGWRKVAHLVAGGPERSDSVRAGLHALGECTWVLVHDAARPLVTPELVSAGLAAARRTGAAVAATPIRDTLKRARADATPLVVESTVDRRGLWAAQTPQVFRADLLRAAFDAAGPAAGAFTDDASLVEATGVPVAIYPGDAANLKLTLPEDIPVLEALLLHRGPLAARERTGCVASMLPPGVSALDRGPSTSRG